MDRPEIIELLTEEHVIGCMRRSGVIVIDDDANRAGHRHRTPAKAGQGVSHVDLAHFREKVLQNQQTHGRYWWARHSKIAENMLEASLCMESHRLLGKTESADGAICEKHQRRAVEFVLSALLLAQMHSGAVGQAWLDSRPLARVELRSRYVSRARSSTYCSDPRTGS